MRAGLPASTITPGRTAPDASLTAPAMVPSAWPAQSAGRPMNPIVVTAIVAIARMTGMTGLPSFQGTTRGSDCGSDPDETYMPGTAGCQATARLASVDDDHAPLDHHPGFQPVPIPFERIAVEQDDVGQLAW